MANNLLKTAGSIARKMLSNKNSQPTQTEPQRLDFTKPVSFPIYGTDYKNEEGIKYRKVLEDIARQHNAGKKPYGGSNEYLVKRYGFRTGRYFHKYAPFEIPVVLEPTTFDGAPAVKIRTTDHRHIGWIPAYDATEVINFMRHNGYTAIGTIAGGERKRLLPDGDGVAEFVDKSQGLYLNVTITKA